MIDSPNLNIDRKSMSATILQANAIQQTTELEPTTLESNNNCVISHKPTQMDTTTDFTSLDSVHGNYLHREMFTSWLLYNTKTGTTAQPTPSLTPESSFHNELPTCISVTSTSSPSYSSCTTLTKTKLHSNTDAFDINELTNFTATLEDDTFHLLENHDQHSISLALGLENDITIRDSSPSVQTLSDTSSISSTCSHNHTTTSELAPEPIDESSPPLNCSTSLTETPSTFPLPSLTSSEGILSESNSTRSAKDPKTLRKKGKRRSSSKSNEEESNLRGQWTSMDSPKTKKRTKSTEATDFHHRLSSTQSNLLRHLESANSALMRSEATSTEKCGKTDSDGADPLVQNLIRKQKLERNRESARESRRRKREHIIGVEKRCRQLERENMELRSQLHAGKEAMKQEEREKNRVCEELEKMIQRGASEKELAEKIDNFKEQYSDYGHGRRSALCYHLHQIERLLLPTQVTKMCIWALRQDDSFWQDEEDETSLPVILAKELGLTDDQKNRIQQQRGSISKICENLKRALALLDDLKTQIETKNSTLDHEMDNLQNILTPTQRAKFIVWVTNNPACMHLLNKLWRTVL
uniref:Uncharacterized protein AlNc14C72G4909 n=1 Tax=Albugo laibachii Nc14 TaxID=890382 RepID=F0WE48_9STRA|nr:conserved hypothetical protein [Albugo laibachii Nc14]|eukprot:CCA19477.1 conserved hypothetical protein [Albugo laibachii Nc14]